MRDQPNILLIMTDQHRLSAVGAYGETPCITPHIDQLAREGVLFENAYTTCPVCSPARGSLMTGLFPHAHGMTSNIHDQCCAVHELADRPELLSRSLQAAGYNLGYTGKWHLGTDRQSAFGGSNQPTLPRDVGFEGQNFPGHGNGGHGFQEYRDYLIRGAMEHRVLPWGETTERLWMMNTVSGPAEATIPYFLANHTIDLLDRFKGRERPFFIWHNFWGPHAPFYVPTSYLDRYRDVEIPEWPNYRWPSRETPGPHHIAVHPDHERLSWDDWAMAIRYYYAYTTLIDEQIGRIMDHLRYTGILENTVVIFAADHGQTLGSHGGLTDKGWHHFEEIQRIPTIIRLPDQYLAGAGNAPSLPGTPQPVADAVTPTPGATAPIRGARISNLVSLADLYPTILDLAGARADGRQMQGHAHGESLMTILGATALARNHSADASQPRDMVVTEFNGLNGIALSLRTVRWSQWKFGFSAGSGDQLYDLATDPHELRNLAGDPAHLAVLREGRDRLVEWMRLTGDGMSWWYRHMLGMTS